MKNNNIEHVDVNQAWTRAFEGPNDAFRVTVVSQEVDTEGLKQAVKEGLSNITIDNSVNRIEVPVIVKELEIVQVEKQIVVKEQEIVRIEVPVIQKEYVTIEKPIIVKEILEIEKPIVIKEQEKFELPKIVIALVGLQAIATLGILIVTILK